MAKCCELKRIIMDISIHSLLQGAERATGSVAFTTAAVALANGASSIVMVRTVEEALALREVGMSMAGHRTAFISAIGHSRS